MSIACVKITNHQIKSLHLAGVFAVQVDATAVVEARFIENLAEFKGGAIYADEESTSPSANEYTHLFAQYIHGNCFMLFGNEQTPLPSVSSVCIVCTYYCMNLVACRPQILKFSCNIH